MRLVVAAFRLQLQIIRSDPDYVMPLVTVPMFTVIFLAIVEHADRADLAPYAVLAPVLIAVWALSLYVSGEIIDHDRWSGVIESVVAAPAPFAIVVVARVLAVTAVALLAIPEVLLVARVLFGVELEIHPPATLAATLALTVLAASGAGVIMGAVFVVARSVRNFQNSLTYPVYVLGGVLVPASVLPEWLEPLSAAVFLSWSADLMRDSLAAGPVDDVFQRLGAIALLGTLNFVVGYVATARLLRRVRATGTLGHA